MSTKRKLPDEGEQDDDAPTIVAEETHESKFVDSTERFSSQRKAAAPSTDTHTADAKTEDTEQSDAVPVFRPKKLKESKEPQPTDSSSSKKPAPRNKKLLSFETEEDG